MLDELGGLEPGVEALLIDFLFDYFEDLLPIIHWNVFSLKRVRFPQRYPQLWISKTKFLSGFPLNEVSVGARDGRG